MHRRPRSVTLFTLLAVLAAAGPVSGQATPVDVSTRTEARRISVTWKEAPIRDVLLAFAMFSGKSIVPGSNVSGTVTADINDQPWDVALRTILAGRGLVAVENEYGIISVDSIENLSTRETIEPILTRSYRISFVTAAEVQATLAPLLSGRGSITVSPSSNTVIISDIARVHRVIAGLVGTP